MTDINKYYLCIKCKKSKPSLQMHRRRVYWWVCLSCAKREWEKKLLNLK